MSLFFASINTSLSYITQNFTIALRMVVELFPPQIFAVLQCCTTDTILGNENCRHMGWPPVI
jgi:hypothetical protein